MSFEMLTDDGRRRTDNGCLATLQSSPTGFRLRCAKNKSNYFCKSFMRTPVSSFIKSKPFAYTLEDLHIPISLYKNSDVPKNFIFQFGHIHIHNRQWLRNIKLFITSLFELNQWQSLSGVKQTLSTRNNEESATIKDDIPHLAPRRVKSRCYTILLAKSLAYFSFTAAMLQIMGPVSSKHLRCIFVLQTSYELLVKCPVSSNFQKLRSSYFLS